MEGKFNNKDYHNEQGHELDFSFRYTLEKSLYTFFHEPSGISSEIALLSEVRPRKFPDLRKYNSGRDHWKALYW